ncbi:MAG: pyrrolo-quinoline quinone [Opitutus sp.]|nr:pyrrolo-quinoline quinone [Opitutus sp.]
MDLPQAIRASLLVVIASLGGAFAAEAQWPQFRGPGGLGTAAEDARPPIHFSPQTNVAWRVDSPAGNSSPVIWGDRLFLTGFTAGKLLTLAYDRTSGRELWRREVTPEKLEDVHPSLGNPATATPATDGERLFVHFGSFGALAYDFEGRELWRRPMKLTQTEYGASSSPILVGENVIQLLDQDGDSHLVALDKRTGKVAWRVERPEMRRGFGTPIVWAHDGSTDLVVLGTIWLKGLDPATGGERWRVSGLARITCTSPVVGDGMLFAASWTTGGDQGPQHLVLPKFDDVLTASDADKDGKLSLAELPPGPAKERFKHLDGNRDGFVDRAEWESMADVFARVENQAFAVKPDAQGRVSDTGVSWRFKKGLPYVGSPLYYRGRFYLVKDGGLLTCLDPQTGKPVYQEERLGAVGPYYASLVGAAGRIYATARRGVVSVIQAGDTLEVLARNDLGENTQATPVPLGDTLFVRTAGHLAAFRETPKP